MRGRAGVARGGGEVGSKVIWRGLMASGSRLDHSKRGPAATSE